MHNTKPDQFSYSACYSLGSELVTNWHQDSSGFRWSEQWVCVIVLLCFKPPCCHIPFSLFGQEKWESERGREESPIAKHVFLWILNKAIVRRTPLRLRNKPLTGTTLKEVLQWKGLQWEKTPVEMKDGSLKNNANTSHSQSLFIWRKLLCNLFKSNPHKSYVFFNTIFWAIIIFFLNRWQPPWQHKEVWIGIVWTNTYNHSSEIYVKRSCGCVHSGWCVHLRCSLT